ncbi:hypothetical protein L596_026720 [Steinernema carpocapsae]|uniref:Uncharacterized protein n=1 Tax=Steinernema carpocapsae TaxID=34508 RepID=A0A4V5ZY93_STECR|nr:hypothetical protein L596_026720 [Steinernema carpocapsae]
MIKTCLPFCRKNILTLGFIHYGTSLSPLGKVQQQPGELTDGYVMLASKVCCVLTYLVIIAYMAMLRPQFCRHKFYLPSQRDLFRAIT